VSENQKVIVNASSVFKLNKYLILYGYSKVKKSDEAKTLNRASKSC